MRAWDPAIWSKQVEDIRASEEGRRFYAFLEFWLDAAEKMFEERQDRFDDEKHALHQAWNEAFDLATSQLGLQSPLFVTQMMALAVVHWWYREALFDAMTPLEKYFVREALNAKVAQLQQDAVIDDHGAGEVA